ncbi:MAG: hypothetical protein IJ856_06165, partial [Candidatus Methanomethylophilaceae archaeon]|nr:hypothetical protein [Candidatus Methanomethylophilaceae archaeon]
MNDNKGSVPFALLAVAILLLSSACVAVGFAYEDSKDSVKDTGRQTEAIERALGDARDMVARGLGDIILEISTDGRLGGLGERKTAFDEWSREWIDGRFPIDTGGATVSLAGYDISLGVESLRTAGSPDLSDGYTPTYLKAKGTMDLKAETRSGSSTETVTITSDGSYGLPLASGQGSIFENMAGGKGAYLSEIMSAQLTSLAQLRVLNGAGSEPGPNGLQSVVTREDVSSAYRNAIAAMKMLCFRDGIPDGFPDMDLAQLILEDSGTVSVDLGAVYAQAMLSVIDDLVVRWYDYLGGDFFLSPMEARTDASRFIIHALTSFLRGEDPLSAEPFIR